MISFWAIVGILASILTNCGLASQVIRGLRTKKLEDLSFWMVSLLLVGMSLWLAYGVHISDWAVIGANIVGVALALALIILKKAYSIHGA